MSAFWHNLNSPLAQSIAWALIHFLWQGTAVAGALAVVNSMTRRASPNLRYAASCAALLACLALPIGTIFVGAERSPVVGAVANPSAGQVPSWAKQPSDSTPAAKNPAQAPRASEPKRPKVVDSIRSGSLVRLEPLLPWTLCAWLASVLLLSARLVSGWAFAQHLRTRLIRPATEECQQILDRLSARLGLARRIWMFESAAVDVTLVIGWLRPVILLPAGLITGLTPGQVETLIAHELAHIRRHDYLVNLLQSVVETLLFYHPLVWWISKRIREERENCCDDLVLASGGDELSYAEALVRLAQSRDTELQFSLAATDGALTNRIQRLLAGSAPAVGRPGRGAVGIFFLLVIGFVGVQSSSLNPTLPEAYATVSRFDSPKLKEGLRQAVSSIVPNAREIWADIRNPNLNEDYRTVLKNAQRRIYFWHDDAPLARVLEKLSELLGTDLAAPGDLRVDKISVAFSGARLEDILTAVLARKRLGWHWVKDGSAPSPIRIYAWSSRGNDYFSKLDLLSKEGFEAGFVSITFKSEGMWLSTVLQEIGHQTGLKISLPESHRRSKVVCDFNGTLAREALAGLLKPLGLDYRVKSPPAIEVFSIN